MRVATTSTALVICLIAATVGLSQSPERPYSPDWASLDSRPTPKWFEDAKFGIFIHWGVYSVPAWAPTGGDGISEKYAEWYQRRYNEQREAGSGPFLDYHREMYGDEVTYQDFAADFRAELFDPMQWADIFKRSGARYVVLTSKHHDGYALWPSRHSWNWNAVDVGPHRDLAGDIAAAVRMAGLRFGFYYSLYEWYNPLFREDVDRYVEEHMLPQFKDLVMRYQPDIVWPDGEWDHPSATWRSEEFLAWLFNESSVADHVAVNDRWGEETRSVHGGFYTSEYGLVHGDSGISEEAAAHKWEENRGIGGSFGYNRAERLEDYATAEQLVELLIEVVSRGGNLLLNVGPTADGRIPVIMQQRLLEIGEWLDVNGEAIYETRPWIRPEQGRIRFTSREDVLYAIALRWPGKELVIEDVPDLEKRAEIRLLGHPVPLDWRQRGGRLTIEVPSLTVSEVPSTHAFVFRIAGFEKEEE